MGGGLIMIPLRSAKVMDLGQGYVLPRQRDRGLKILKQMRGRANNNEAIWSELEAKGRYEYTRLNHPQFGQILWSVDEMVLRLIYSDGQQGDLLGAELRERFNLARVINSVVVALETEAVNYEIDQIDLAVFLKQLPSINGFRIKTVSEIIAKLLTSEEDLGLVAVEEPGALQLDLQFSNYVAEIEGSLLRFVSSALPNPGPELESYAAKALIVTALSQLPGFGVQTAHGLEYLSDSLYLSPIAYSPSQSCTK